MKKFTSFVLIAMMIMSLASFAVSAAATTFEGTEVTWELVDGVMTIDGTGAMPDYRGAEDSRPWIDQLGEITKVVVKGGVTHVGASSFTQATALEEVVLEEGVETVGMDAFSYVSTLTTITFPESLKELKQGVFYSCSNIATVNYPKTQDEFKANVTRANYNDSIFAASWGEPIPTEGSLTDTITWKIADGVLTIAGTGEMPDFATEADQPWIANSSKITKVVVEAGITKIGKCAFSKVLATEIVVAEGVETIMNDAFAYNGSLTTITLPSTVKEIKQGTVYGSGSITTVNYYGESKEAFLALITGPYNENYTKEGVTFNVLTLDPPVDPDPTPDTPVDPDPTPDAPQTGDATVYAIVLAVVALMGMGVVVTKKVRA